nr:SDR family NAD(P)-dependent oxidoreductase [Brevibacterium antiquum]
MADTDLTVLVTGGSSGIGAALVRMLADRGYTVLTTSRDPERVGKSQRVPGVRYLRLDLADPDSVEALGNELAEVDVLVNNAGESQSGPFEELPPEAINRLFRTNVIGPVRLSQLALPGMRKRRHGRIIMVGSMLASFPWHIAAPMSRPRPPCADSPRPRAKSSHRSGCGSASSNQGPSPPESATGGRNISPPAPSTPTM